MSICSLMIDTRYSFDDISYRTFDEADTQTIMYILRHSFGRIPTSLISCYAFELGVKWFVD